MHRKGHTVDEIIRNYPPLRHADVFDALAYVFDHADEMDKNIADDAEVKAQKTWPSRKPPAKGGGLFRGDDPIVQEWLKIMQENRRILDEEEGIER